MRDPSRMSRLAVARRLGVSKPHVVTLLDSNPETAPVKVIDGRGRPRCWYDASSVECFAASWTRQRAPKKPRQYPPRRSGKRAARVARWILAHPGGALIELVAATAIDPEECRRYVLEFSTGIRDGEERRLAREHRELIEAMDRRKAKRDRLRRRRDVLTTPAAPPTPPAPAPREPSLAELDAILAERRADLGR